MDFCPNEGTFSKERRKSRGRERREKWVTSRSEDPPKKKRLTTREKEEVELNEGR